MKRGQFTFYRSFWEAVQEMSKKDKADVICAICAYALDGEEPKLTGNQKAIFSLIRPTLDTSAKKAQNASKRNESREQNENKTKTKAKQNAHEGEKEKEKEIEIEKEKEKEKEKEYEGEHEYAPPPEGPPLPAPEKSKPQARAKYGAYGWVRLTLEEYARLLDELGKAELERCIRYVDESAQKSGNKNRWKDWNLVIRNCHLEGWGLRSYSNARNIPPAGNWPETPPAGEMDRMAEMLRKMGG